MRYISIIFLLFFEVLNGQKTYPYLFSDSVGSQFVVLTLDQAQKLDNATEFSPTFWKDVNKYYVHVDSLCTMEIEVKNRQIDSLSTMNTELNDMVKIVYNSIPQRDEIIKSQNQEIKTLKEQIVLKEEINDTQVQLIKGKDKEIKKKNRDIKYLSGFSIILMIGVVISSIF
jgi:hypothetical protein